MRGLARVGLAAACLCAPAALAEPTAGPDAAVRAPEAQPRLVLGPGGRDVRLFGPLEEGAGARLEALLAAHPGVARIHLTSEGGLADEGRALGAVVAAHGLTAYVPDYCVSACTLVFVRGRVRHLLSASRLGFHGPYEEEPSGRLRPADAEPERAAYLAAGLSPGFVDAALAVPPDDLWVPAPEALVAAGVATGIVDTRRYPDSTLDDGDDLDRARATVLRNVPLLRGFAAHAPGAVEAVAAWYRAAYRDGLSEHEAVDGLRWLAARVLLEAAPRADAARVAALGRYLLRAMARAEAPPDSADREDGLRLCARIGAGADLVLAEAVMRAPGAAEGDAGAEAGDAGAGPEPEAADLAGALAEAAALAPDRARSVDGDSM